MRTRNLNPTILFRLLGKREKEPTPANSFSVLPIDDAPEHGSELDPEPEPEPETITLVIEQRRRKGPPRSDVFRVCPLISEQ